jgi:hypothetical protein
MTKPLDDAPAKENLPAQPQIDWLIASDPGLIAAPLGLEPDKAEPQPFFPMLVEFRREELAKLVFLGELSPLQAFSRLDWLPENLRGDDVIRVPGGFGDPGTKVDEIPEPDICVLFVAYSHLSIVISCEPWQRIVASVELGPLLDAELFEPPQKHAASQPTASAPTDLPDKPRRVVIGVIDEGIPFAHARFRHAGGTRIAHLWQQGCAGNGPLPGAPGRTLSAADIDAALTSTGGDEDQIYRAIGGLDYARPGVKALGRSRSHGAHVLDLVAGDDPRGDVRNRPIVAVDMPNAGIGDPAASLLTPLAALGLLFILDRARAMREDGETLPVIVTLSYGPHEGPHDGGSTLERFMDWLVRATAKTATPMRIVLAAGNARQARAHAAFDLPAHGSRQLAWRLQPGSLVCSRMQIWLHNPPAGGVQVKLTSPSGQLTTTTSRASPYPVALQNAAGRPVGQARYWTSGNRHAIELTIAPTSQDPAVVPHATAPSGRWTVEVLNPGEDPVQEVHAWIARADTPADRPARGRQSYFDDPEYARFDPSGRPRLVDPIPATGYVRRATTLSGIATGARTDIVGARGAVDPAPRRYSSDGPHLNGSRTRPAPESLATGDRSPARRGVLAAGTRSASVRTMNGTSVAAPQAARWLADQWLATGALPVLPASIPAPP